MKAIKSILAAILIATSLASCNGTQSIQSEETSSDVEMISKSEMDSILDAFAEMETLEYDSVID